MQPKGDKRCIKPIVDNCDVVAYLEPNGVDEDGHVIKSSAYFAQTDKFFARSRYDFMVTKIEEFTADNLEKAISDAITKQEEADGIKSVSYDEQQSFEQLQEEIALWGGKLAASDHMETLTDIVEQTLGVGKKVSQCTKKQTEAMSIILEDIKDACAELGVA